VSPSLQGEGFPQVINEALAAGLPVIASAVGGIPAYLQHGETGLLVPPGNSSALSAAINTILQDSALHQRLARQGQSLMRSNTLEANRDRIVSIVKREVFHEHKLTAPLGVS
jgi:glycosyltransferase involved in cell wall biosynthesis